MGPGSNQGGGPMMQGPGGPGMSGGHGGYMGQPGYAEPNKGYVNPGMYNRPAGGYAGGPGGYPGRWGLVLVTFLTLLLLSHSVCECLLVWYGVYLI